MKKTILLLIMGAFLLVSLSISCTADKLPAPQAQNTTLCDSVTITYDAHIKSIFDRGCNYAGCHDGNTQASLTNYSDMSAARRSLVYNRTVVSQDMPPSHVTSLTSQQIDSITCWKEGGFPEN